MPRCRAIQKGHKEFEDPSRAAMVAFLGCCPVPLSVPDPSGHGEQGPHSSFPLHDEQGPHGRVPVLPQRLCPGPGLPVQRFRTRCLGAFNVSV